MYLEVRGTEGGLLIFSTYFRLCPQVVHNNCRNQNGGRNHHPRREEETRSTTLHRLGNTKEVPLLTPRLLTSRVLVTPANGPNTELAKNLILAGVNVTLYDDATVNEDDFESNFLVAKSDIGRPRGEAVFSKLKEMNPSGKN